MSFRDKWVRRFSIDETAKHKNGFTIYKITSVLFPLESPEAVTVVSVWKRYSDVQQLHKSMKSLHSGLHLKGTFPQLAKSSFFKRFSQEVIDERAKTIKALLEFVAEHRLLFTSTDFVNFLQSGYPEPEPKPSGVINAIRSSLQLPIEEAPPLEYQTSDDEARSPTAQNRTPLPTDMDISQIPIYEPTDVEIRESPRTSTKISESDSFESINSIESLDSDLYEELNKLTIQKTIPSVKRNVLPDLINFDAPSTSKFEDYHTMPRNRDVENSSATSTVYGAESERRSESSASLYSKTSAPSLTIPESTSGTEDSRAFNPSLTASEGASGTEDSYVSRRSAPSRSVAGCGSETEDSYVSKRIAPSRSVAGCGSETEDSYVSKRIAPSRSVAGCGSETEDSYVSKRIAPSRSVAGCGSETEDSRVSKRNAPSRSAAGCGSETEDSYIFAAGYSLNVAASCEQRGDYRGAFDCYKSAIEKMLIGVKTDPDQQRRALIKEKTNKYLSYAEEIYKNHLCNVDQSPAARVGPPAPPLRLLARGAGELARYRVLAARAGVLLVLHAHERACRAMKIIQKIPCNLTEFDDYFHQRSGETRQPILPTMIPYMVPLHAYIETDDLIFLILSYAPGERLFDYVKNYRRTAPDTREVNLENVFNEPIRKNIDIENDNIDSKVDNFKIESESIDNENDFDDVNENSKGVDVLDNIDVSVNELVKNSQKLLLNVDRVLTEVPKVRTVYEEESRIEVEEEKRGNVVRETETNDKQSNTLPPGAVCRWGAELLTALESLHNCGAIWRDLHPRNVLLGSGGQLLLTHCAAYCRADVALAQLARRGEKGSLYVAPELLRPDHDQLDCACDFWSFGAIMYELICGFPLSRLHGAFTAHTELQLPPGLPLDASSLLTQLLTYEPAERLGSGEGGVEEIKRHPYFRHVAWRELCDSWLIPD